MGESGQIGDRERKPWLLESLGVLLLVLDMALGSMAEATGVTSLTKLMAALFAPAIFVVSVVGVARLFRLARTRRGTAQLSIGVLSLMLLGECGQLGKAKPLEPTASEVAKVLASEGASMLPRQVGSDRELFAVVAEGSTVIYSYRLLQVPAQSADRAAMEGSRPEVVSRTCGGARARRVLQQGVVLRYAFYGSDRLLIASLEVSEGDCAAGPSARPTRR